VVSGTAPPPVAAEQVPSALQLGVGPSQGFAGSSPPVYAIPDAGPRLRVWRIVLGCLLVIALSAAATVVVIKGEISTLASDLSAHRAITLSSGSLAPAGFGDPQTILLIGNDQRAHTTTTPVLPHSNEMLLVRIDPNKPWISMMSIPRELQVALQTAHGPVTTRLNAALIYGGTPLLLSTIKQLTGLSINHVVEIDFNQFKTAVNHIGCVYSTVDRRYYHVNTAYSEQYQEINLQPGYQRMCGVQALQFVSYRHGDTSLVRDARDQDFLLDVKKEYGPSLSDIGNIHRFERIFGRTVEVDRGLQTESGVENLLGTLISSESLRVRQVKFQVNLQPIGANSCACDTATPQQIAASVHSFLHGADAVPKQSTVAAARAVHHRRVAAKLPLVPVASAGLAQARGSAGRLPFPLEYPRVQDAGGSSLPVSLRDYLIRGSDGGRYPAYVAVFSAGLLGQYYDVQGMTWTGAPMFANPDQTVTVARRTYSLFYSGQHLMVVAWHAHGAVYWVHNTLTDAVGNGELLAIAEQTVSIGTPGRPGSPIGSNGAGGHERLKAVVVPTRAGPAATSMSPAATVGSIGGLLTLIAVPVLSIALLRRRRGLSELRGQLYATMQRATELSAVSAAGPSVPSAPSVSSPASVAFAPARAPTPRSAPAPVTYTKHRSSRFRAPSLRGLGWRGLSVVLVIVVLAGVVGVGALLLGGSGHVSPSGSAGRRASSARTGLPDVPVAVLNATSTPGAAGGLAQRLRAEGVRIAAIGNVAEAIRPGLSILYSPGARAQAARLARLLPAPAPAVAPIDGRARAAAGRTARVVAVIG
jgi:LCP family protein required for cell wall assembly